ncbi:hypothetical protein P0136_09405 [Lentisphaerota bacterium ZTH]|nr:hypothetical protein JYG24_13080 [Lentisphaerota bacterium]WET05580.1 hypothetical protein P0136_09405 [Lentisphaerota bacterium ZTH]
MKRSFLVTVISIFTLTFSLTSAADVRCRQCGQMTPESECYGIDPSDLKFRLMYLEQMKARISIAMPDADREKLEWIYNIYHRPICKKVINSLRSSCSSFLISDYLNTNLKDIMPLPVNSLPIDEVRKDILNATGIPHTDSQHDEDAPAVEVTVPICQKCMVYEHPQLDSDTARPTTPLNIQLAMVFDKLVNYYPVIVILHEHGKERSSNQFLIDYMKLYSQKEIVFGFENFDPEENDINRPEFLSVKKMFMKMLNADATSKITADDTSNHYKTNEDIYNVIGEYALPVYDSKKHDHESMWDPHARDFLALIESRCPNSFCFGMETPVSFNTFLFKEMADPEAMEHYQKIAEQAFMDMFGNTSLMRKEAIVNGQILKALTTKFRTTETCNREMAKKVVDYFFSINRNRQSHQIIPIVISIGAYHGTKGQRIVNQKFIQDLIKEEFIKRGIRHIRVGTILTHTSSISEIFSTSMKSRKSKVPFMHKSIDFVMSFQTPAKYNQNSQAEKDLF